MNEFWDWRLFTSDKTSKRLFGSQSTQDVQIWHTSRFWHPLSQQFEIFWNWRSFTSGIASRRKTAPKVPRMFKFGTQVDFGILYDPVLIFLNRKSNTSVMTSERSFWTIFLYFTYMIYIFSVYLNMTFTLGKIDTHLTSQRSSTMTSDQGSKFKRYFFNHVFWGEKPHYDLLEVIFNDLWPLIRCQNSK